MKYIPKYQNPSNPFVKVGQFLPNQGMPIGYVPNTKYSGDKSKPKVKSRQVQKSEETDPVADVLSELGTRTLSAVGSLGGSIIGDVVNEYISPNAADALEKYTLGIIPHTTNEQFISNKEDWGSRLSQAAKAGAVGLSGQGVNALMQKYAPVIANKIANLPTNETEKIIQQLSNPTKLEKFIKRSNVAIAEYPKYDIIGNRLASKTNKSLIEAEAAKHAALNKYATDPSLMGKSAKLYLQPYDEAISKIKSNYQQKVADRLNLPIDIHNPKGSGAFGSVYGVKNNPNLVVKIGKAPSFETPRTMSHLSFVGKQLKDPNIALPLKTTFHKGRFGWENNITQVMPLVPGKPQREPINVSQEAMDDLFSKIKLLKENKVLVDFINPDNVLYDQASGKFSLVDLNTTPPKYHPFNQINELDEVTSRWQNILKERYQASQPESRRPTMVSPEYTSESVKAKRPRFIPESFTVNPMKRVNMWSMFKQ